MNSIIKEIVINAPIEKVWSYLTDSSKLEKWLMPNNFKPELQRKFIFECVQDDCEVNIIECVLLVIIPYEKLVFSWYASNIGATTKVSISLKETDNGIKITLIHSGWDKLLADIKPIRDDYDNGWESFIMDKLKKTLAG